MEAGLSSGRVSRMGSGVLVGVVYSLCIRLCPLRFVRSSLESLEAPEYAEELEDAVEACRNGLGEVAW